MSTFEDGLWSQLVREHGDHMHLPAITARANRRRPALITASALATADCPTRGFLNAMPTGTNPSTYTITIAPGDIPRA
jgi:hypothetical protein